MLALVIIQMTLLVPFSPLTFVFHFGVQVLMRKSQEKKCMYSPNYCSYILPL
eukprot:UN27257